ncbi:MAG: tRNA (adenosine(37)-N6)-dimethylallyltransferase MiaA [Spirochaetales bacterium]|nr:tRNA (adenosine(37)-N6)-dimethylallyltransferase MiaA [Spirochaetales bacterium]
MNYRAIALFGPTGVGKTALSLKLAARYNAEIISVDSMQVYRYMDIGTAKILPSERNGIIHHLIDSVNPDESFTAGDFKRFSESKIVDIANHGKTPFLVGGTGFYFSTLINGIVEIPEIDEKLRDRLYKLYIKHDRAWMYRMLELVDHQLSLMLNMNDSQRVLRGLEVFFGTGRKLSDFYKEKRSNLGTVSYLKIALNVPRNELYDRINRRVDAMVVAGLESEVRKLLDMGYTRDDYGMKGIGYAEFLDYFDGKYSFRETVDKIKQNSRHYAKRQLTWFRKMEDVYWFSPEQENEITLLIERFLA